MGVYTAESKRPGGPRNVLMVALKAWMSVLLPEQLCGKVMSVSPYVAESKRPNASRNDLTVAQQAWTSRMLPEGRCGHILSSGVSVAKPRRSLIHVYDGMVCPNVGLTCVARSCFRRCACSGEQISKRYQ